MKAEKLTEHVHRVGELSERLMMTTRWYPLLYSTVLVLALSVMTKHLL